MRKENDEELRMAILKPKELISKEKDERVRKGLVGFWIGFSVFVLACIIAGGIYVFVRKGAAETAAIVAISITGIIWIVLSTGFLIMMLKAKNIPNIPVQRVQATLLEKGKYTEDAGDSSVTKYYAIFEFADGVRRKLDIGGVFSTHRKIYKALRENENGVLYYRDVGRICAFRGFECGKQLSEQSLEQPLDRHNPTIPIHSKPSIFNSKLLSRVLSVIICLLFIVIWLVYVSSELNTGLILSAVFIIYLGYVFIKFRLKNSRLRAAPEQQIIATVFEKMQNSQIERMYITFSFADGMMKKIHVPISIYTTLVKGDTGVLTFKEIKKYAKLINFERRPNA